MSTLLQPLYVLMLWLLAGVLQAQEGTSTAQLLNARYLTATRTCVGGLAPLNCSGVLARTLDGAHPTPFWKHDAQAIAQGYEPFTFLREDQSQMLARDSHGYLLFDRLTAVALAQPWDVVAGQQPDERPLRVQNWDESLPARIGIQALYYYPLNAPGKATGLAGAQRNQLAYFQATGTWLPIVRVDLDTQGGHVFGFDQQDQLYNGQRVAERLNQRFAEVASTCRDGRAAFYCYGVLIRAVQGAASFKSWNPSSNSVGRNGVSFSYIRADVGTQRLAGTEGLIYRETAAPVLNPLIVRCAYPANAGTSGIPDSCRASCESRGITTVAAWRSQNSGCAFAPNPAQFQLNIDVNAHGGAWNEIIIAAWAQNIPRQLALEASFYTRGSGGLNGARYIQRDYYEQAQKVVPVIQVNLGAGNGQVFAFLPQDQNL
ncbi:hypothetical protein [Pseudomonas aegrilactucae]|uniref:Halovibrin HvnA n=1 Tax=Pseudomonas aegrilactucae TaxID=2854028 RepID=A0A9Q2XH95_9PSED|nr:hypothetical protein [Pseudomonas aegrilactucae]MBV6286137.1 hypothetical protein [Pseudomonas aegrilactucae]